MRKLKKLSGRYLTNISCGQKSLKYLLLIRTQIKAILAAHPKSGLTKKSFLAMSYPTLLKPSWPNNSENLLMFDYTRFQNQISN